MSLFTDEGEPIRQLDMTQNHELARELRELKRMLRAGSLSSQAFFALVSATARKHRAYVGDR